MPICAESAIKLQPILSALFTFSTTEKVVDDQTFVHLKMIRFWVACQIFDTDVVSHTVWPRATKFGEWWGNAFMGRKDILIVNHATNHGECIPNDLLMLFDTKLPYFVW